MYYKQANQLVENTTKPRIVPLPCLRPTSLTLGADYFLHTQDQNINYLFMKQRLWLLTLHSL